MSQWITTWAQAHADMSMLCKKMKDYTSRLTVFSGISGKQIRVKLSNLEGKQEAEIVEASIQIGDATPVVLGFGGKQKLRLAPGETVYCDPVELSVASGEPVTVSLAFAGAVTSGNILPECVRCSTKGNYVRQQQMPVAKQGLIFRLSGVAPVLPILSSIEVCTDESKRVIVCFGDSITQMSRWTKPLEDMFQCSDSNAVVVNKGIGGNQLLSDPVEKQAAMFGRAGFKRFKADVMEVMGASDVILALGVNDFNAAKDEKSAREKTEAILKKYRKFASQARAAGMRVYAATVTPSAGCKGYQKCAEPERRKLNDAIRKSGCFDGVLDFDVVVRDPDNPEVMKEYCDSGDHVHPGVLGGMMMARTAYEVLSGRGDVRSTSSHSQ